MLIEVQRRNLLHRDISPDNIFLLRNEYVESTTTTIHRIKLIDFGSARSKDKDEKTGFMHGTYTAPEVIHGDHEENYTDIYSVGCVLYFMLMGKAPKATSYGKELEPPDADKSTPDLTEIFLKATRHEAKERYQTAEAMLADLRKRTGKKKSSNKSERKRLLLLVSVLSLQFLSHLPQDFG